MKAILISKMGAAKIEEIPDNGSGTFEMDVLTPSYLREQFYGGILDPKIQPVTRILFRRSMTAAVSGLTGKDYWVFEEV